MFFTIRRCVEVVRDAVVVGHSRGGYVATAHAAEHAEDLGGMILVGCTASR